VYKVSKRGGPLPSTPTEKKGENNHTCRFSLPGIGVSPLPPTSAILCLVLEAHPHSLAGAKYCHLENYADWNLNKK